MNLVMRLPIEPRGKARHRTTRTGRTYVDRAQEAWTRDFVALVRHRWQDRAPLAGPVVVSWIAVFPAPMRLRCRHKRACGCGPQAELLPHTAKPDRDNVDKAILDGLVLAGVLRDDAIVWGGVLAKGWSRSGEGAIDLRISDEETMGGLLGPQEDLWTT